jgi:glucosamine-6-phosphate deaminase
LVHPTADLANAAAAERVVAWLTHPSTRNVMVAGGNTPLDLYRRIAECRLPLSHLNVFVLDEYVGVPATHPRACGNLLRRSVAEAWGVPEAGFFPMASAADLALASALRQEQALAASGGLDLVVLGLGRNGHLGFNEPGSPSDSTARLVALEPRSVEANRQWFGGEYSPALGVTHGLKTLLAARHVVVLAYGAAKAAAVRATSTPPPGALCPASFLQSHPDAWLYLDGAAASG